MIDLSNLKRIRLQIGLSQTALAKRAGVTQAHIAKIEAGKVDPRFSTVKRIMGCLEAEQKISCEAYMSRKIVGVNVNQKVSEAAKIMKKKGISQMPVFKGKDIVGLLTEKGIVMNSHLDLNKLKVSDLMEDMPPKISKFTSIDTVKELLLEFPAVVVMDAGKAVGIITKSNLLK